MVQGEQYFLCMMAFSILLLAKRIMSKTPQPRPCLSANSAPCALGFTMFHSSLLLEPWVKHGHILHVLATHTTWKRRIQNINSSSSIPIADCTKKKKKKFFIILQSHPKRLSKCLCFSLKLWPLQQHILYLLLLCPLPHFLFPFILAGPELYSTIKHWHINFPSDSFCFLRLRENAW